MNSLGKLPSELELEVIQHLSVDKDDLCNLRLVSRHLNVLTCPILFSHLHLKFIGQTQERIRFQEIITALSTRSTNVFDWTTKLDFASSSSLEKRSQTPEARQFLRENLYNALLPLKNLRHVDWQCDPESDPEDICAEFICGLGQITTLEDLELKFQGSPVYTLSLQSLSNLRRIFMDLRCSGTGPIISEIARLLARCPNLEELHLMEWSEDSDASPTLDDFFAGVAWLKAPWPLKKLVTQGVMVTPDAFMFNIRHFRQLEFLDISRDPGHYWAADYGEVLSLLKEEGIFLKGIATDAAHHPFLMDYLSSYSGIQSIKLRPDHEDEATPQLIKQFFYVVLPNHRQTLQEMELGTKQMTSWSRPLHETLLQEVAMCKVLRKLKVYIGVTNYDVEVKHSPVLNGWLKIASQLPDLVHLQLPISFHNSFGPLSPTPAFFWGVGPFVRETVEEFIRSRSLSFELSHDTQHR